MTAADVKALRASLAISQSAFADRIGVTSRTVRRWESGDSCPLDGHVPLAARDSLRSLWWEAFDVPPSPPVSGRRGERRPLPPTCGPSCECDDCADDRAAVLLARMHGPAARRLPAAQNGPYKREAPRSVSRWWDSA